MILKNGWIDKIDIFLYSAIRTFFDLVWILLRDSEILVFIPENDPNEMFNVYDNPDIKEVIPDLKNKLLKLKIHYFDKDEQYSELQSVLEKYYFEEEDL